MSYLIRLDSSRRLNLAYFTCLEAQNDDKFITFGQFGDGMIWGTNSEVFYTLRAGPPTQLSLVRVSF